METPSVRPTGDTPQSRRDNCNRDDANLPSNAPTVRRPVLMTERVDGSRGRVEVERQRGQCECETAHEKALVE